MNVVIDGIEYQPKRYSMYQSGIVCPDCGEIQSDVYNSRVNYRGQKRHRKCRLCGAKWKTLEVMI